jgi:hypothetical protein
MQCIQYLLKLDAVHPVSIKLDIEDIETVKSRRRPSAEAQTFLFLGVARPSPEAEMFPSNPAANIDQKFISLKINRN